jgi:hypothetical protein
VRRLAAFGKGGGDSCDSSLPPPKYDKFQAECVGALNGVEVERWPELSRFKEPGWSFRSLRNRAHCGYAKIP